MLFGFDIFVLVVVVLAIALLFGTVKTVPQGYNWTVERFGRYTGTLRPGLNFIMPVIDRIGHKINMMEQAIDIPQQDVITKDNATVTVDGLAFYQVIDAAKASYEIANLDQAIVKLTMTNIRSVMGSMDLDQMLSHRDEINERLLRVVDAAVGPWGVKVNRIEIKDIVPPANLVQSMGRQMQAEREKRAEILSAEGQRQSAILKAEGAKQSQILEAEGRREAAFRDAEARERLAQAEAKATEMVSEAVARGDVASLNYFVAQKYLEAFGKLAQSPNQKVLIVPMEATAVLGSLAGIGEIAKATFGPDGSGAGGSGAQAARAAQSDRAGDRVVDRLHDPRLYAAEILKGRRHDGIPRLPDDVALASRGRHPVRARAAGARRLHAVARPLRHDRRRDIAGAERDRTARPLALAVPADRLCGAFARLPAVVAARGAPRREAGRSAVPQSPRRCLRRPRVHAGEADRVRARHGADRRHDLAARRAGMPGRQPGQGRARRCRAAGGGAGVAYATPARSRSCRCTMPTGLPASSANTAVIFDELSSSSASLTS